MTKIVPKEKMSKKARKQMNAEKRTTWTFSPVTRKIDSKKIYNRKRIARFPDGGAGFFLCNCAQRRKSVQQLGLRT